MIRDLTWTGNQFLAPETQSAHFFTAVQAVDLTTKDDVWSERVALELAAHHGLRPEFVRVAAGATQLIDVLLRALHRRLVVDVTPNFHLTATIARREGWDYRAVPVREPDGLLTGLAPFLDRDDVVLSLSSPRNPLGYQFSLDDIARLLDRTRCPVLLDEVYADFAPVTAMRLTEEYENLVVVRTFSKAWGLANLRIGFAVSALLAPPGPALPLLPNSVAGVAQRAARHLLAHPGPVRESIAAAQETRARMITALERIPGLHVWPSDANYVCVETPLARDVVGALADIGYPVRLVNTLKGYPPDWPPGVRITVPPPPDAEAVVAGISRVLARSAHDSEPVVG
jgi:histidinol-phosphate aminotransferase